MTDDEQSEGQDSSKVVASFKKSKSEPLPGNLDELRALLQESDLEAQATDSEAVTDANKFYERFGLKWKRQADRECFIQLKSKYALSDREILMFFLTGNLKIDSKGARLTADPIYAVGGGLAAVVTGSIGSAVLVLAILAFFQGRPFTGQALAFVLAQFGLMSYAIWSSIIPAFAQRRVKNRKLDKKPEVEQLVEKMSRLKR